MRKWTRYTAVATIVGVVVGLSGGTVAVGETPPADVLVMVGSGTVSPGWTPTVCSAQTISFAGTLVIAGDERAAGAFQYNGTEPCGSLLTGSGSGTVSGAASATLTITRTGVHATVKGSVTIGGDSDDEVFEGVCEFTPTSWPTVTSFEVQCAAVLTS